MAAYDNISLGNAPGAPNYAAPLINFGALSELPAAYQQGTQDARTRALQGAFREGLPRDAQGNLDIGKMSETLAKLGGADAAMPLINLGIQQQQGEQLRQLISGGNPQSTDTTAQPTTTKTAVPAHGIPSADSGVTTQRGQEQNGPITPQRLAQVQNQPPSNTGYQPDAERVTGSANSGAVSLKDVVTQAYGDAQAGAVVPRVAAAHGIADANAPLDPDTLARVQRSIAAQKVAQGQAQPTAGSGGDVAKMTDPATLLDRADAADREARKLLAAAAGSINLQPGQKEALEKAAQSRFDFAKQAREAYYKTVEPTTEMKNARSVGQDVATFKRGEVADKAEVERYNKLYSGIQGAARSAADMKPHLDLMNSFVNNPNFYSGPGEGINLYYKRVLANIPPSLGGDPNAAVPQEGMRKVLAANILNQVDQMKAMSAEMGSGSSRIFQSQVGLMTDAAQKPDNSPAAIRFLTELGVRAANHADAIAELASNYKGGRLDPQFEIALRKFEKDHPMFTHQELADTRLIAPPVAPGTLRSTADVAAWTQKAGLKRGDPFKLPDGSPGWAQ